jgi:hypothetical protein
MTATHQMMHGQLGTRAATVQRTVEDGRTAGRVGDVARRRSIVAAVAAIRHRADATALRIGTAYQTPALGQAGTCLAATSKHEVGGFAADRDQQRTGRTKEVSQ